MIPDFRDLLAALSDSGVRFLVVEEYALAAHGLPRATGHLDIWMEPTDENAARVCQALAAFGAPLDTLDVSEADFRQPDRVIQLGLPPYRVDLLTSISGVGFAEAWPDPLLERLFEIAVPFIGRESFIRNKRATGRPKDLRTFGPSAL